MTKRAATSQPERVPQCKCGETVTIERHINGEWCCDHVYCKYKMPSDARVCEGECDTFMPLTEMCTINDVNGSYVVCTQCMQTDRVFSRIKDGITGFQALAKGAMTRHRLHFARLSADPTNVHQAVQFCVNGFK